MLKWLLHTERYRSGHNEAVLKTVWRKPQGFESLPLRHFFIIMQYSVQQYGVVLKLVTGFEYERCLWQIKRVLNGAAVDK